MQENLSTSSKCSQPKTEVQNTTEMDGKYLTFWTDSQLFGIPISDVVQIVGIQKITSIPEFPDYAKGIINLRGNIIPIIDVRLRLHKQEIPYDEHTCIIVTNMDEIDIGFIVDSVDEVTRIDEKNISQPPKMSKDYTNSYLTGVGKLESKVVLLLDTRKMLSNDELHSVAKVNEK